MAIPIGTKYLCKLGIIIWSLSYVLWLIKDFFSNEVAIEMMHSSCM